LKKQALLFEKGEKVGRSDVQKGPDHAITIGKRSDRQGFRVLAVYLGDGCQR
jgi:hypothetical protein